MGFCKRAAWTTRSLEQRSPSLLPQPQEIHCMRSIVGNFLAVLALSFGLFGQTLTNIDTQTKGSRLPSWCASASGTNSYTCTSVASAGPTLRTGSRYMLKVPNSNTGAVTLAVDGLTAQSVKKNGSSALSSGDWPAGLVVEVVYDGT